MTNVAHTQPRFDVRNPPKLDGLAYRYVKEGRITVNHEWVMGGSATTARIVDKSTGKRGPPIPVFEAITIIKKKLKKSKKPSTTSPVDLGGESIKAYLTRFEKRFKFAIPQEKINALKGYSGMHAKTVVQNFLPKLYSEALVLTNNQFKASFPGGFTAEGVPRYASESVCRSFKEEKSLLVTESNVTKPSPAPICVEGRVNDDKKPVQNRDENETPVFAKIEDCSVQSELGPSSDCIKNESEQQASGNVKQGADSAAVLTGIASTDEESMESTPSVQKCPNSSPCLKVEDSSRDAEVSNSIIPLNPLSCVVKDTTQTEKDFDFELL